MYAGMGGDWDGDGWGQNQQKFMGMDGGECLSLCSSL